MTRSPSEFDRAMGEGGRTVTARRVVALADQFTAAWPHTEETDQMTDFVDANATKLECVEAVSRIFEWLNAERRDLADVSSSLQMLRRLIFLAEEARVRDRRNWMKLPHWQPKRAPCSGRRPEWRPKVAYAP